MRCRPPDKLAPEETNYWPGTAGPCQFLALFEAVATAAGPDLTNESFAQAAADIGNFSLPVTNMFHSDLTSLMQETLLYWDVGTKTRVNGKLFQKKLIHRNKF